MGEDDHTKTEHVAFYIAKRIYNINQALYYKHVAESFCQTHHFLLLGVRLLQAHP